MCAQIFQEPARTGRPLRDAVFPDIRTSALSACLSTVAAWIVRSGERRALRELAEQGRLLGDVGLTREQALDEAAKPFWRR
jgi:uncharacterized protein YjiS (DUF1127 family)